MSTVFSPSKARVTQAPAKRPEPKLRIVYGAPFRPPRMPFVIFVVSLLAAGLVGLLLLNTELQRGTFQITALNQQADQLRDNQEQLERQVRTLESPQNLADRALRMGMVPNPNPVFLRLSDGQVLGVPAEGKAGTGAAMFGPGTPTTTSNPTTQPSTPPAPPAAAGTPKPPAATPKPPATTVTPKPPAANTTSPPNANTTKPPASTTTKPPASPTTQRPPAPPATDTNRPTGG
jgi:outer membrane biosynthesis protein TonB